MSIKKLNLENLIQQYLLEEEISIEKLKSPDFDFGFIVSFPPGPKSQKISVFKVNKRNCLYITIRSQLSDKNIKILNSFKDNKKFQIFNSIRKFFLIKEVYFRIDIQNSIFEINEQIYPDKDGSISKDTLFKVIKKIFYCFLYANILMDEYCMGKEISPTKLGPEFDLSLYS
ncbi:MAG: DUF2299 family protein [Promethearchaeota archaeon]